MIKKILIGSCNPLDGALNHSMLTQQSLHTSSCPLYMKGRITGGGEGKSLLTAIEESTSWIHAVHLDAHYRLTEPKFKLNIYISLYSTDVIVSVIRLIYNMCK